MVTNLREALRRMIDFDGKKPEQDRNLEKVTGSYNRSKPDPLWPPFLFPLADPGEGVVGPQIPPLQNVTLDKDEDQIVDRPVLPKRDNIDKLAGYLVKSAAHRIERAGAADAAGGDSSAC